MHGHSSSEFCSTTHAILHLWAVSYEQYRAIVKDHLSYDDRITPKKIIISISVLWILPTAVSVGPFLGWGGYEYNPIYECGQRWDHSTTFPLLMTSFFALFLFIFVANYKVIKVARRIEREVNVRLGSKDSVEDGQLLQLDEFPTQNGNQRPTARYENSQSTRRVSGNRQRSC